MKYWQDYGNIGVKARAYRRRVGGRIRCYGASRQGPYAILLRKSRCRRNRWFLEPFWKPGDAQAPA